MLPMGSSSRRLLNQSTHSSVANSTASNDRHGPRRWMTIGLVETVDGLGESIVIAVPNAAYRRFDASFRQALGVFDRDILAAPVAVMHEPAAMHGPPVI